jgi:antitoxin HigA-1
MPMKNPPHPGLHVRHDCLEALELSVTEGAKVLGVTRQALNNLVNGKSGISPEMAIRLSKAFGGRPGVWLKMQMDYDLAQAEKKCRQDQGPAPGAGCVRLLLTALARMTTANAGGNPGFLIPACHFRLCAPRFGGLQTRRSSRSERRRALMRATPTIAPPARSRSPLRRRLASGRSPPAFHPRACRPRVIACHLEGRRSAALEAGP